MGATTNYYPRGDHDMTEYRTRIALTTTVAGKPIEILYAPLPPELIDGRVLVLTTADIDQLVASFLGSFRLAVNCNHQGGSGDPAQAGAVGWITRLFRQDSNGRTSLMADVEWIPTFVPLLAQGSFRFISAELLRDPLRLVGAAVCNSPAVPDLAPISLARQTPPARSHSGAVTEREVDQYMGLVAQEEAKGIERSQARYNVWLNPRTRALSLKVNGPPVKQLREVGTADPYAAAWSRLVTECAAANPARPSWYATAEVARMHHELRLIVFAPPADPEAKAFAIATYEVGRGRPLDVAVKLAQQHTGGSILL